MNILFLTRLYFPHIGGVERHVAGVATVLKKNHKLTIITEQHEPDLALHEQVHGIEVFRIPVVRVGESEKKWVIWKWVREHASLFNSADIIHTHDVFYWLYWYRLLHPIKKIFTTFHGWEGIYPIPLKNIIHKNIASILSNGTIAVGDYISKWYGIKPDLVTYGAASPPSKRTTNNQKKPTTLLFLGRLDSDTGIEDCVKRYYLSKHLLNWKLVVAGDGLLKKIIPPDATHVGLVSNPANYITQADYVFTTGYMGILESFIHKKVVLSYYKNPLKKDYLLMHPMAKYLIFDNQIPKILPDEPYQWAISQTPRKLSQLYLKLWSN